MDTRIQALFDLAEGLCGSLSLDVTIILHSKDNRIVFRSSKPTHIDCPCLSNLTWSKPKLSEHPSQAQAEGENAGAQSATLRTDDLFKRAEEISSYDLKVAMVIYYREDKRYEVYLSNRDFGSRCPFLEAIRPKPKPNNLRGIRAPQPAVDKVNKNSRLQRQSGICSLVLRPMRNMPTAKPESVHDKQILMGASMLFALVNTALRN